MQRQAIATPLSHWSRGTFKYALPAFDAGARPPVVLLHSSLSSKQQWKRLALALSPQYRVIAIDLHGYGERAMPIWPPGFSLANELALVLDVIGDEIGDTPFHLVGHSYGGAIALRLAAEQGARVRSLALYEPVAFGLLDAGDRARQQVSELTEAMDRCLDQDPAAATQLFIDYWNGAGAFAKLPAAVQADLVQRIAKVPLDFQALFGDDLTLEEVADISVPVCLLSGLRSPESTRRIIQSLALALPGAERHVLDAGHMAPLTHADQVNPLIAEFVDAC
jgi:pimeloyl-ACP methyl ester carboxylesterase